MKEKTVTLNLQKYNSLNFISQKGLKLTKCERERETDGGLLY